MQLFVRILCPAVNGTIPLKDNTDTGNLEFRGSKVCTKLKTKVCFTE